MSIQKPAAVINQLKSFNLPTHGATSHPPPSASGSCPDQTDLEPTPSPIHLPPALPGSSKRRGGCDWSCGRAAPAAAAAAGC
eukprot:352653-Chlamydomonas_euryale.AAC.2